MVSIANAGFVTLNDADESAYIISPIRVPAADPAFTQLVDNVSKSHLLYRLTIHSLYNAANDHRINCEKRKVR